MGAIQADSAYQIRPAGQPSSPPAEYRFTLALATTVMSSAAANPKPGYVSNLNKFENNYFGGHLDVTA